MEASTYSTAHAEYTVHRNTVRGGAPYTVFLHGGPGFHNYAERRMLGPAIHERLNVLWFDLLGCRESPARSPEAVTFENTVNDIRSIVEDLAGGRVNVVAHCFASLFVHKLAQQRPETLGKIVLIDPVVSVFDAYRNVLRRATEVGRLTDLSTTEEAERARLVGVPGEEWGPAELEAFGALATKIDGLPALYWHDQEAFEEYLGHISEAPFNLEVFLPIVSGVLGVEPPDFRSLDADTSLLIVQGEQDAIVPWQHHGELIAGAVSGTRVELVPGAAHWPHLEARPEVAPMLVDFLSED